MKKQLNTILNAVLLQKLRSRIVTLTLLQCVVWGTLCLANGNEGPPDVKRWMFEIENQTPCFFVGGYQLTLGTRYDRLRVRAEIQNTGSLDVGDMGIDHRNENFQRNIDNVSVGIMGDYFLSERLFVSGSLETRNWKIHDKANTSENHLRTLDVGIGAGYQYMFYQNFFVQAAVALNFREGQTVTVGSAEYRISNIDCLPMIRLGVRF